MEERERREGREKQVKVARGENVWICSVMSSSI